jgi:hypothetical protein
MTTPANFNNIDLDITHYDTDELLAMLNLKDPTEDDIINATTRFIKRATADRLPKVAAFFQDAQDTLLDELDKQPPEEDPSVQQEDPSVQQEDPEDPDEDPEDPDEDPEDPDEDPEDPDEEDPAEDLDQEDNVDPASSDQLGQWWRNQYLKQADKVQANKATSRDNKIQVLQGNVHMPTKQEKLGINQTYEVPIVQGTLNPLLKNTMSRTVNIDSQYRQIITPNAENPLGPASPTNYTIDLTDNLTNVVSIKLNSIQIPYAWYAIDYTSGTNVLFYRDYIPPTIPPTPPGPYTVYAVPPGNYTPQQLQAYMSADVAINTVFDISFNPFNGKMSFKGKPATTTKEILFFDPTYHIPFVPTADLVNDAITASKVNSNLGWLMGFRGTNFAAAEKVAPNTLIYRVDSTSYVTSEALADTYGPKYLILVLDDYNQNHLNKGLVNIATNDTKLSLPSYFTPGQNIALPPSYFVPGAIPVVCDTSGNTIYVQSNPRKLTQAQIYTINTIQQDRNNTTIDRYTGPTTTDVLAVIPVKTYSLLPGQPYIEFGSALQTNERIYFGPVNIERMKIQLIDDKGNILNMHGNDWSMTITSTHAHEF